MKLTHSPEPGTSTKRRGVSVLALLIGALLIGTVVAQDASSATAYDRVDLPVTRLVLFTSGVGYFEHDSAVTGNSEMVLTVPLEQMDDLLQSLVLQDFGGGSIKPVTYSSQEPLDRLLADYPFDLAHNATLATLLQSARGEEVELVGSETVTGLIAGLERVETDDAPPTTFVTLVTATGIKRVQLEGLSAVRFSDPELNAQLSKGLTTIAANRSSDSATVTLRFEGEGTRGVRVGYVREMPVWKSSYRLSTNGDGTAELQGWAIVDNPTSQTLDNVQLSFVAGQPVSFITSLYQPIYVTRPRLETSTGKAPVPQADSGQMDRAAPSMAQSFGAAAEMMAPMPTPAPALQGAGVEAMASAAQGATSFAYELRDPVSIGAHQSALVPIVITTVPAERVSIFNAGTLGTNPLHALRLRNDSGLQLAAGSVTIFADGGFQGNAQLPDMLPGDDRLLSYAVDLGVAINVTGNSEPSNVTAVALRGGLLETTQLSRRITNVEIDVKDGEERFLIVELPRSGNYEIVSPQPAPARTATAYRFGVAISGDGSAGAATAAPSDAELPTHLTCQAGEECLLRVVSERLERQSIALNNLAGETLALYLENAEVSAEDRATLDRFLALQSEVVAQDRLIRANADATSAIYREQERIRSNMGALDRNSELYRRYVASLNQQEDQLLELQREHSELTVRRQELQRQLDELLRQVSAD